eukprot:1491285-Pyramimonas_sp.AAC.1
MAPRGSQRAQDAPNMAHDNGRLVKIASDICPRGLKITSRRFQVLSDASDTHPRRPTSFKHLRQTN